MLCTYPHLAYKNKSHLSSDEQVGRTFLGLATLYSWFIISFSFSIIKWGSKQRKFNSLELVVCMYHASKKAFSISYLFEEQGTSDQMIPN